jgi:hypothetical protein
MNIQILVAISLLTVALCIPFADQVSLVNSLIVVKQTDLFKATLLRILSLTLNLSLVYYPNFVVLAFRYFATAINIWQDLLYVYQVADEHMCSNCKVHREYDKMWNIIRA